MEKIIAIAAAFLCLSTPCFSQSGEASAFAPIGKYMRAGDYDNLSVWFADNLELDIFGQRNICSRNQARLIMKSFFEQYTPKQFTIIHKSGPAALKYAIAELSAGGEVFSIFLCVNIIDGKSYVEQLVIGRR